jgi:hypothetical protein
MIADAPVSIATEWEDSGQRSITWPLSHAGSLLSSGKLRLSRRGACGRCDDRLLTLSVIDAEARATLEARGVGFAGETLDTGVCHMACFADPDGNALMLHDRYAPRMTEA